MKIAVIGSNGLIGSRVVTTLRAAGHEAVGGDGDLAEALGGAAVVVDVSDQPSFDCLLYTSDAADE